MMIELQQFIEFGPGWFSGYENTPKGPKKVKEPEFTRENMIFQPITINTEYIATLRRYVIKPGPFEFCQVWMVDQGNNFIVDKTYEEMRDLVMRGHGK